MPNYSDELDAVLRALADPTRRMVVERLAKSPAVVSDLLGLVLDDAAVAAPAPAHPRGRRSRHVEQAGARAHREPATRLRSTSCTSGSASSERPPNVRQTASASISPAQSPRRPRMTRVRIGLFSSLDGYTAAPDPSADNPMGEDWGPLTAAYAATRTFRQKVLGDTTGAGTTGVDESYASAYFSGVGAEIMGAAMFGLHANPGDPDWKGLVGRRAAVRLPGLRADPLGAPPVDRDGRRHDVPLPQRRPRGRARGGHRRCRRTRCARRGRCAHRPGVPSRRPRRRPPRRDRAHRARPGATVSGTTSAASSTRTP